MQLWNLRDRRAVGTLRLKNQIPACAAFSPDNRTLAVGEDDNTVTLWDLDRMRQRGVLAGHKISATAMTFWPDGRRLATASYDGTVKIWDPATLKELITLGPQSGSPYPVSALALSPDGTVLASGSSAGAMRAMRLWYADQPSVPGG